MMKKIPFSRSFVEELKKTYPTPFYVYDEAAMLKNIDKMKSAFSWNQGYQEFFAVKAAPNPYLMKLMHQRGLGMDCSSLAELELCDKLGIRGEQIMFTSNNTPAYEYEKARALGAIINLDDITQLDFLEKTAGLPDLICFRYNPGAERSGTSVIGTPAEAKFGVTRAQLVEGFRSAKAKGVRRFGLHTMPISNELNPKYFIETVTGLLVVLRELEEAVGIKFEFINMGGGIGIPYRPEQEEFPLERLSAELKEIMQGAGRSDLKLYMECGRYITGPYGYLVTSVQHFKNIYRNYVGVDATMANLMRPGMYGSYHHISVMGKENLPPAEVYDVVGSLCENNDKFAIQRELPRIEHGDILVIHDSGAHGHAMGFNYNGKLRCAEFLMRPDGSSKLIRRAETLSDLFATLDFGSLASF